MVGAILQYIASVLLVSWGTAHLFPTRAVVVAFGNISVENSHTIAMEWILEGVSLIFIGILVATVTFLDRTSPAALAVYWLSFGTLNVFSAVSWFTGFKNSFIAFKLCPFIFTGASLLILFGICLS